MSAFDTIKGIFNKSTDDPENREWKRMSDTTDLKDLDKASNNKFNRCINIVLVLQTVISLLRVYRTFRKEKLQDIDIYMMGVITQRVIFDKVLEFYRVKHELL